MTQERGDLLPAPVYWWTEQEYNIEEKDVLTLARIELDKLDHGWSEEEVERRLDAAMTECRFRQQGVYGHIRKTGRKGPSWKKFMALVIEGVDGAQQGNDEPEREPTIGRAWPFGPRQRDDS